jgi:thiol:disulfide interchange protein
LPHDSKPERIGVFRMLFGIFFLGISVFLYTGLGGKPLGEIDAFMPPIDYNVTIQAAGGGTSQTAPDKGGEVWLTDYQAALAKARSESKPVFIDFTGFACTNCRWMESNVFTLPAVKALMRDFVIVRLYTDGSGADYEANQKLQETRFGTVALPLYVIMSNDDKVVSVFPGMTRKPQEFVDFLENGLAKTRATAAL